MSIRRLVLVGGGHAHIHMLADLARAPIVDAEIVLITPHARQAHSAMLPGWIAGHYALDECAVAISTLAQRAKIIFVQATVTALDPNAQRLTLSNGDCIGYDWLSINSGSAPNLKSIVGAEHALLIRPIESLITGWQRVEQTLKRGGSRVMIIGSDATACELAMSVAHTLRGGTNQKPSTVMIATNEAQILTNLPEASQKITQQLQQRGIAIYRGVSALEITPTQVELSDGHLVKTDCVILANGSTAAQWPQTSGLALDENGYIQTNVFLQSSSHANIFAAGDCATMREFPHFMSGSLAVRQGPPLTRNLRNTLAAKPLKTYKPKSRSLALLSCGERYAVACWGNMVWQGSTVWSWKDRIDRKFISRYNGADSIYQAHNPLDKPIENNRPIHDSKT